MDPTAEGRVDPSKIRKRGYLSWFLLVTALVTVIPVARARVTQAQGRDDHVR